MLPLQIHWERTTGSLCPVSPRLCPTCLVSFADFNLYPFAIMSHNGKYSFSKFYESFWQIIQLESCLGEPWHNYVFLFSYNQQNSLLLISCVLACSCTIVCLSCLSLSAYVCCLSVCLSVCLSLSLSLSLYIYIYIYMHCPFKMAVSHVKNKNTFWLYIYIYIYIYI